MSEVLVSKINEAEIIKNTTDFQYQNFDRFFLFAVFQAYPNFDSFKTKGDNPVTKYCHLFGLQDMETGQIIYAQHTTDEPTTDIVKGIKISARFLSFKKNKYNIHDYKLGDISKVEPVVDIPDHIMDEVEELKTNGPIVDSLKVREIALNATVALYHTKNITFTNGTMTPAEYIVIEAEKFKAWLLK